MSFGGFDNWSGARDKASENLLGGLRERPGRRASQSRPRPAGSGQQTIEKAMKTANLLATGKRRRDDFAATIYGSTSGFEDETARPSPQRPPPKPRPVSDTLNDLLNEARPEKRPKLQPRSAITSSAGQHKHHAVLDDEDVEFEIHKAQFQPTVQSTAQQRTPASSNVVDLTLSDDEAPQRDTLVSEPLSSPLRAAPAIPAPAEDAGIGVCSCKKAITTAELGDIVQCASPSCPVSIFHRACVGLSNRKVMDGWRCWQCRPKPPPVAMPPRTSQLPPATQTQRPASPPTMKVVPTSAPLPPPTRGESEPDLHPEQLRIIDQIMMGGNVFFTGSAGTGKSTVLKAFVQRLKDQGRHVDIIAPSGIAALNVGGMTIYAYAGWHPDSFKEPLQSFVKKSWGKKVRERLCRTDVLVIDEISMVERDVLVRLDTMMREVRTGWKPGKGNKRMSKHGHSFPFGGAQVVVTGDFCQLPPVKPFKYCMTCGGDELPGHSLQNGAPLVCKRCHKVYHDNDKWAFTSDTWKACGFAHYELRHIHRQSDKRFIDILQKCRYGQPLSSSEKAALLARKTDPVGAVQLLPRRHEVESENTRNFNNLRTPQRTYDCHDVFMWRNKDEPELQSRSQPRYPNRPDGPLRALQDHRFEEQVKLKEGMLVILLVNLDFKTGLVNGSQGKIIGFEKHSEQKVFPTREAPVPAGGMLGKDGGPGPQSEMAAIREGQVRDFILRNHITQWPVVQFLNGHVAPIYAHCQLSELGSEKPYSLLGRTQMPLLAAWAITVHKSQGMTLNSVIVDLHNSFEREMVYVALSRARSLDGLRVVRLARSMDQGVNKDVQAFLRAHGLGGVQ